MKGRGDIPAPADSVHPEASDGEPSAALSSAWRSRRSSCMRSIWIECRSSATHSATCTGIRCWRKVQFEQAIEQFQGVANRIAGRGERLGQSRRGVSRERHAGQSARSVFAGTGHRSAFDASILGRGLALAALGRYDEALEKRVAGLQNPGVPVVAGWPLPGGCGGSRQGAA